MQDCETLSTKISIAVFLIPESMVDVSLKRLSTDWVRIIVLWICCMIAQVTGNSAPEIKLAMIPAVNKM